MDARFSSKSQWSYATNIHNTCLFCRRSNIEYSSEDLGNHKFHVKKRYLGNLVIMQNI